MHRVSTRLVTALIAASLMAGSMLAALPSGIAEESLHHPRTEQWRSLVEEYWGAQGYSDEVEYALMILHAESTGVSTAVNSLSQASGLFQHLPKYWEERSRAAGWAGADIFDPEANIAVAAWLRATSPERGWKHWEPTHDRYPVGSWGSTTHWDASRNTYVGVGGGSLSTGGVFREVGPPPSLSITKSGANGGQSLEVPVGDRVMWTYEVTNTGETDLWALYLWDDALGEIRCPEEDLGPGETVVCTASHAAAPGDNTDKVLAFAWDNEGSEASADGQGTYRGVLPSGTPDRLFDISVGTARWYGHPSDPIVRSYVVRNVGAEPLWAVFIWDSQVGEVACPDDDLLPGRSVLCWTHVPEDSTGTVTVWAWTTGGEQIEVAVELPSLQE